MPTPLEDALGAEFAEIRESFIRSLEPRTLRLRALLAAASGAGWTRETRAEVKSIAHALAGACGSFGFASLGQAAMTLEDKLIDAKADECVLFNSDLEHLIALSTKAMQSRSGCSSQTT